MILRTVLCLWLILFLYPGGLQAQVYSDRKVRKFKTTEKHAVEVSNKYGKIHVIAWDKDSVKFEVDLRISANSYQKMEKLRDNISFDFTSSKYYIVAKTVFASKGGIISDFVDAFIPSNQVTINYMVYVPRNVSLKIENKFGDIYMDDFNGNVEIILSNGDLKANKLSGTPIVKLSSGNGTINNIQKGKVYVSYSDLRIKASSNMMLESRSSRITLDQTSDIIIDSRRDKIDIQQVDDVSASGYFTSLNIENLTEELRCNFKYGNIMVEQVSDKFTFINLDSEYTDIDLMFDRTTSYLIDIAHSNDVYINLPASLAKIQTRDLDVEKKLMLTYGKIGSTATETSHKVKINAPKKCVINIIHR
jgi:hypothetical protein